MAHHAHQGGAEDGIADKVAQLVIASYDALPNNGKPLQGQFTVLSGTPRTSPSCKHSITSQSVVYLPPLSR